LIAVKVTVAVPAVPVDQTYSGVPSVSEAASEFIVKALSVPLDVVPVPEVWLADSAEMNASPVTVTVRESTALSAPSVPFVLFKSVQTVNFGATVDEVLEAVVELSVAKLVPLAAVAVPVRTTEVYEVGLVSGAVTVTVQVTDGPAAFVTDEVLLEFKFVV